MLLDKLICLAITWNSFFVIFASMCILMTLNRIASLTLTMLWANSADYKLIIFLSPPPPPPKKNKKQKKTTTGFDILCNVSQRDNLHEISKPIFWENKKNVSKYGMLKFYPACRLYAKIPKIHSEYFFWDRTRTLLIQHFKVLTISFSELCTI